MRLDARHFIILLCLTPDDFTFQGKSAATQWAKQCVAFNAPPAFLSKSFPCFNFSYVGLSAEQRIPAYTHTHSWFQFAALSLSLANTLNDPGSSGKKILLNDTKSGIFSCVSKYLKLDSTKLCHHLNNYAIIITSLLSVHDLHGGLLAWR